MSDAHQTLDLEQVRQDLHVLLDRISKGWGRVEIANGGENPCVLISKAELDTIERALEIYYETPSTKQMCEGLTHVANVSVRHFADEYEVPTIHLPQQGDEGAGAGLVV